MDIQLLEHPDRSSSVILSDSLWSADDDRSSQRQLLRKGQRDIAGSRWQIDEQIVQFAPGGLVEKLGKGLVCHGASPDHRFLGIDELRVGHRLDAGYFEWIEHVASGRGGHVVETEHRFERWSIDIAIKETYLGSKPGETQCQIDGNGGLADTTFSSANGNDVPNTCEGRAGSIAISSSDIGGELHLD